MVDIEALDTLAKAYALHNKIHAQYVDARWGRRKKADMQADHEAVVRRILDLGGRHIAKGEVLDETLPQELKEAFKLHYVADGFLLSEDTPPSSIIQIFRTGTFHHPEYGKFIITQETLDTMVSNFAAHRPKPPTEMVVDWEHMSVAEPPVKSPAAGWVQGLDTHDGGLFATVEWTDEAASEIRKKEYRFISPEFSLDYNDKETGKPIGATLLSVALTNRPFIEGMQPVMLCESLASMLCADEPSYGDKENRIRRAYDAEFNRPVAATGLPIYNWVQEVYDDYCIVEKSGVLYKLPYAIEGDTVFFYSANEVKVTQEYVEVTANEKESALALIGTGEDTTITASDKELDLAEWTTAYINDLPDSSFAYIKSGGEKDEEGRTTPRALRYLPYKDEDGKVDMPHLRNALSRLPQTKLTPDEKAKARAVLIKAAQAAGVGEYSELPNVSNDDWDMAIKSKEELQLDTKKLCEVLGIAEDADPVAAVEAMKTTATESATKLSDLEGKVTAAEKRATDAEGKLADIEADKLVQDAIKEGKLTPAMADEAKAYVLSDREGFTKSLEFAAKVAPEMGTRGKDTGGEIKLTELEEKIAKKLGIDPAKVIALKESEAEKEV